MDTRSGLSPQKKTVSAKDMGSAITESLADILQSRGLTKDGKELPALTASAVMREELGYMVTSAVYVALCAGGLPRQFVDPVFDSFLEDCAGHFPQRDDDRYSADVARQRAKSYTQAIRDGRQSGLSNEEAFMLVGSQFSEASPHKRERPALLALGSQLFGVVLAHVTDFMKQALSQYDVVV